MNPNIDKRLTKLEKGDNPSFMVRWPDKRCEFGKETYDNTPIPEGCSCVIDLLWRDIGNL